MPAPRPARQAMLQHLLTRMFPPAREPIGELAPGRRITVCGEVVPRDLLQGPLTARPCVYYQYSVESWRRSRVGGDVFWELIERDEAILEFYIADATGRAIVSPARVRVTPGRGVAPATLDLGTDRRGHELLLEPGDRIEVTGEAVRVHDLFDEGRDYRDPPDRFMLQAPEGSRLEIRLLVA